MFDRSKAESLCDVSVTTIGDTLSHRFPQTELYAVIWMFLTDIFFSPVSQSRLDEQISYSPVQKFLIFLKGRGKVQISQKTGEWNSYTQN